MEEGAQEDKSVLGPRMSYGPDFRKSKEGANTPKKNLPLQACHRI